MLFVRILRGDIAATIGEDFILAARARGIRTPAILIRHALRPSAFALLTVLGLSLGQLIGGTVIVEQLFGLPGMGQTLIAAINGRDVHLQWQDGAWSATDAATGAAVAVGGTGTADDPLTVAGMALVLEGPPASQDRFLLQPTAQAAGGLSVAITDPARIAAASQVKVQADLGNIGSGKPGPVQTVDAGHPGLLGPAADGDPTRPAPTGR